MNKKVIRRILIVLAVICGIAALWFGYSVYVTLHEYDRGNQDLNEIYDVMGGVPSTMPEDGKAQMDEASLRAVLEEERRLKRESYAKLKEQNSDMIGWIHIDGTVIDYPVMQTPEIPDFYLHRGFNKEYSVYGMVYMDASCDLTQQCPNYLLYGHHMKNGSMFASIEKYASQDYYRENRLIEFDLLDDDFGTYEVVGAFKLPFAKMDRDFAFKLAARTEKDYNGLVEFIKTYGFYDTGITPKWPEQLITLTTCEYTQTNGRFILIGRRVPDKTAAPEN